jgi:glycerophosphoryl diester phosphodiesterase
MKIIESSIIGKKSPEACEDGMVVTDDFIAVIDGSTSKTPKHLNPDVKNGRYAMMLISEYIREELKTDASVDEFCQGVTAYIYNKVYEKLGVEERLKEHPEERLTASAILYSRTRNEVWMVGDCQAIIDGKLYENGKPYEEKIARKRVELIEQGLSPAEARKQIEPLLIKAMLSGQNQTYTVIDGFPIYREGVKVVSVSDSSSVQDSVSSSDSCSVQDPVSCSGSASASDTIPSSSSEIVLASDGYPFLKPTLAASEAALAEQIANDPQNIRSFIATKGIVEGNKSFDDRTYIRFVYCQ